MKNIHLRKLLAVMEVKSKTLLDKTYIIMPLFSIGFAFLMRFMSSVYMEGGKVSPSALANCVIMNICMCSIFCVAGSLAEEKEKHTLRVLMTSSVNGMEFYLGSVLPVLIESMIVNTLLPFITGLSMTGVQWGCYLLLSTLSSLIGTIMGMLIGIYSKDQMNASVITTPFMLLLLLLPMLNGIHPILDAISSLTFTGVILDFTNHMSINDNPLQLGSLIVLIVEIIIATVLFLVIYKKSGFEAND